MRRVVVTGIGAVLPQGVIQGTDNPGKFRNGWKALLKKESGIVPLEGDSPIHGWGECALTREDVVLHKPKLLKVLNRNSELAVVAAQNAMQDAGLAAEAAKGTMNPERLGVILGADTCPLGQSDFSRVGARMAREGICRAIRAFRQLAIHHLMRPIAMLRPGIRQGPPPELLRREQFFDRGGFARCLAHELPGHWLLQTLPFAATSIVAGEFGAEGPRDNVNIGCASGLRALRNAGREIREGTADVILAGGTDSRLTALSMGGFGPLGLISQEGGPAHQLSRPFHRTRKGAIMSEAAAVLVLEEYEHAKKRGARIYAELTGWGCGAGSSAGLTAPDGKALARAITAAHRVAGLNLDSCQVIQANGIGTVVGDREETLGIMTALGAHASGALLSCIKGMTGHSFLAAGALGAAVSALSVATGKVPACVNLEDPDPECKLNFVQEVVEMSIRHCLVNAFGYGGFNDAIILSQV